MELQKFLIEAIQKRFSANATVKAIENQIKERAVVITYNKYEHTKFFADGLEFELEDVKATLRHFADDLQLNKIELSLAFFCISKLPKAKREQLESAKQFYEKHKHLPFNNYKVPIWYHLHYSVDIERVLSGEFNLDISKP